MQTAIMLTQLECIYTLCCMHWNFWFKRKICGFRLPDNCLPLFK